MPKTRFGNETRAAFFKATTSGNPIRHGLFEVETDVSCDCEKPIPRQSQSKHTRRADWDETGRMDPGFTILRWVRCRKCKPCLRANARHWAARATVELGFHPRTWFVTLTGTPEYHCRNEMALGDYVTPESLVRKSGEDVTKAMKRLRSYLGYQPRYLAVSELHESGWPHWHLLIHEVVENTIRKRLLAGDPDKGIESLFWPHGFVHARLVDKSNPHLRAWYVCKYLKKDHQSRTRASIRYGSGGL